MSEDNDTRQSVDPGPLSGHLFPGVGGSVVHETPARWADAEARLAEYRAQHGLPHPDEGRDNVRSQIPGSRYDQLLQHAQRVRAVDQVEQHRMDRRAAQLTATRSRGPEVER